LDFYFDDFFLVTSYDRRSIRRVADELVQFYRIEIEKFKIFERLQFKILLHETVCERYSTSCNEMDRARDELFIPETPNFVRDMLKYVHPSIRLVPPLPSYPL